MVVALQNNKTLYYYLNFAMSAGVLLYSFVNYTGQFELTLLYHGVLNINGGVTFLHYKYLPSIMELAGSRFTVRTMMLAVAPCAVAAVLAARLPLFGGVSLADKHLQKKEEFSLPMLWLIFGGCFAVFAAVLLVQYLLIR